MSTALVKIRQDVVSACMTMRYDAFLADADWDHVILKSHLNYPYRHNKKSKAGSLSAPSDAVPDAYPYTDGLTDDMEADQSDVDKNFEEARQRALNALKTSFAKQRNKGLLTDEAVTVLRQAVDSVQNDSTSVQFVSINQLKRNWKLFGILPKMKNMIERRLYGNSEKEIRNPWRDRRARKCHKAALSTWLEIVMQTVIMLNLALMVVERILERKQIIITASIIDELDDPQDWDDYNNECEAGLCGREIMDSFGYVFLVIYIIEVLFKGLSLKWKVYFDSHWNQFDFVIVIISIIEAIASAFIQKMIVQQVGDEGSDKGEKAVLALKSIKVNCRV